MNEIQSGKKLKIYLCVGCAAYGILGIVLVVMFRRLHLFWTSPAAVVVLLMMALLCATFFASLYDKACFLKKLGRVMNGQTPEAEREAVLDEQGDSLLCFSEDEILNQIYEHLQESSASRALKTEAELHALQNQINPHFLYNTLEIIRSRAMVQGNCDVAEMVEALAMLFRYCINSPGELASLAQELDNVRDYLLIQRYRYGDRFEYKEIICDDDADVMDSRLPVMTLQPIIENSLVHGINPKVEGGTITLRVEAIRNRLRIIVEDDGVGIDDEELKRVRRTLRENPGPGRNRAVQGSCSIGIAMGNVNQRIQFYFGNNYGLDIVSTRNVGTSVIITLPRVGIAGNELRP